MGKMYDLFGVAFCFWAGTVFLLTGITGNRWELLTNVPLAVGTYVLGTFLLNEVYNNEE